ncbi:enduracididine biosynthesis enzyme MppP [Microbispora sp. NEAU-D428]|uniref:enduracididine biosynthesis enzyme MppP n=1 Tax=Microbispora sitophila TaxID=2771537 RepID=UPI0018684C8E|nr:enduracididine biosynthesis enzyme MppP [Microbispora sitophila]MBE3015911.1 enduracididine biosynthesis enzyme MppP [Microbispora sitophila]
MTVLQNSVPVDLGNLTQYEFLALNSPLNLSDGHARQELTAGQARIVEELPALWADALKRPVAEVEADARSAFFGLFGQHSYPRGEGRVLACYSSSVAMEIFARSLATVSDAIGLIHPTFDNIPDILRGVGLTLLPIEEDELHHGDLDPYLMSRVGAIFVTTPNNPTGRVVSQERLRALAEQCARYDVVLALDTCFRGFDTRAHYDHYAVLRESGCRWVVIEDTGKLWPTLELKIGWLVSAEDVGLPIEKVYSDILLGVSPLIMSMVRRLAEDAAGGGLAELHEFIAGNRALLRSALADVPDVHFLDPGSRASVERIGIGSRSNLAVWSALSEHSVFALPCQKFFWADPARGEGILRIALARPPAALAMGAAALRTVLSES